MKAADKAEVLSSRVRVTLFGIDEMQVASGCPVVRGIGPTMDKNDGKQNEG